MTAATQCTLTLGIADLQAALNRAAKYAEPPKQGDEQPITCRVRLSAGKEYLVASSTDNRSSIAARAKILGDSRKGKFRPTDGPFVVDLLPTHARALADSQTPNRLDGEDHGECILTLGLDEVTVTDSSGKYPGVSHTVVPIEQEGTSVLPGAEDFGYPPVERLVGQAISRAQGVYKDFLPYPGSLARLEAAAKGENLVIQTVGDADNTGWLFWSETGRFAGQLLAREEDDQARRRRHSRRLDVMRWFGLLTAEDEARIALGGDDVLLDSDVADEDGADSDD